MRWQEIAALAALLVIACGGGSSTTTSSAEQLPALKNPVTITFWHAMHGGSQKPTITQLADQFNSSQSLVKVNLVDQVDYPTLLSKTVASIAAGQPPTAAQCYTGWADQYNKKKALADITQFINAKDGFSQGDLKDFFAPMLNDGKLNGKQYTIPFNKSVYVLYYNEEMFKEAGLPAPPKNWDEFVTDAKKLATYNFTSPQTRSQDGKHWGTDFSQNQSYENLWESQVVENGGTLVNGDKTKTAFNSSAGRQSIQMWADLVKSGVAHRVSGFDDEADLGSKHIGMMVNTIAGYSFVKKSVGDGFMLKTALVPAGTKSQGVEMAGTNVCTFSKATPDEQHGAFLWTKFLTSKQSTELWSEKTGYMPVRQSAAQDMKTTFYNSNPDGPNIQTAVTQLPRAFSGPPLAVWDESMSDILIELVNIVDGKKSDSQGLSDAAKKADDLLANG
ncbi:MAG: ABC transporter substrate-binding protein [Candidatus Dormibacteraeota bacterium]|uniref:ABC transporter substrate-binding protein n=1 Tax=Candidatus Dormiibacter inghamiae TaxID=3127013 RepID=A0A934NF70_9BACT|nr:ABC transporter substrate-binding protein [Candidatus Dormibacteraeota bacterium]MBJ7606068.1 ABC transporter substrate-binding protein [Candidatus Dormibacteraeota bacterium]